MKRAQKLIIISLVIYLLISLGNGVFAESGFTKIEAFSEGLAAVQNKEGLWGYIDETGKAINPCTWDSAGAFNNGIASVRKDWKYGCIDMSGRLAIPCEWNNYSHIVFSEGLAPVQNDEELWGFINVSGTVVIPCKWEGSFAPRFSEGLAAVSYNGRMGYINRAGDTVIPCQYLYANAFSHGYALVQDEEGLLFVDQSGTAAFPDYPHAIQADSFREDGIALLSFEDNTIIFIDTNGKTICSFSDEYRTRSNFHEGRAGLAKMNEKGEWREGYIDQTGHFVIPCNLYSSYYWFMNGRTSVPDGPVTEPETRYGVIDLDGSLIYPFALDEVVYFYDTVAEAKQNGKCGAINTDGQVVIPFIYDDVKVSEDIILCLLDGKINIYDYSGNMLKQ